jgi:integrase
MKWHNTKFRGVRYREHPTRKHGVQKDRYFAIRYQVDGDRKEEGLGWGSDGWTAEKSALELAKLKEAHTKGEGPTRLRQKRDLRKAKQQREDASKITFKKYFKETYYPIAKLSKKFETYRKEDEHLRLYIEPVIGALPLQKIAPLHLERIKKNMLDQGKSPRTIAYVFATIRQVWNMAKRDGLVIAESPTKNVKLPKLSNGRLRFLSYDEADALLNYLRTRSEQLHNISLLSLHCGLRAGEIFNLKWGDVDLEHDTLILRDTKSGKTRYQVMTSDVRKMLLGIKQNNINNYVFPDKNGQKIQKISNAFPRAVQDLDFNKGIVDRRDKVVFHTLRHTYASWLVEDGTDLYIVKELMGHSSMVVTQRYSHLKQDNLRKAVKRLQKRINHSRPGKKVVELKT